MALLILGGIPPLPIARALAPTSPTTLYSNDSTTTAQAGIANPTNLTDTTPAFSALCNDPDVGDILNKAQIQVSTDATFASVTHWDSGAAGTVIANCIAGNRSADIVYGSFGTAPTLNLSLEDGAVTYYWRIKFWDDELTEGAWSAESATFTLSDVPPAPTNGDGGYGSDTELLVTWTDNSSSETGFEIDRKANGGSWTLLTTTAANVTSYYDTSSIAADNYYEYRARAVNASGNSAYSTDATPIYTAPSRPTNLSVTFSSGTQADLTWTDNSSIEDGFLVQRGVNASTYGEHPYDWTNLTTLAANTTSYSDTSFSSGYVYRVIAYKNNSVSGPLSPPTNMAGVWRQDFIEDPIINMFQYLDFAFDSSGNYHVVYQIPELAKFQHAYYDGTNFHYHDLPGTSEAGIAMELDSSGKVVIVYYDRGASKIKAAVRSGSTWTYTEIANATLPTHETTYYDRKSNIDLEIDSSDNYHIAYLDNGDLKYGYYDGAWTTETAEAIVSGEVAPKIDIVVTTPHIAYYKSGVKRAYKSGTWTTEMVDSGPASYGPVAVSIRIDGSSNPHIAYGYDASTIKYASWNGSSWGIETAVPDDGSSGMYLNNLGLEFTDGKPMILYTPSGVVCTRYTIKDVTWSARAEVGGVCLQYPWEVKPDNSNVLNFINGAYGSTNRYKYVGGSWASQSEGISGTYRSADNSRPKIAMDSSNNPHIGAMISTDGTYDLKHFYLSGGIWQEETIASNVGYVYPYMDISINPTNNSIHFFYKSGSYLVHAYDSGGWTTENITSLSSRTVLASTIDNGGNMHVVFLDPSTSNIKYAKYDSWLGSWAVSTIDNGSLGSRTLDIVTAGSSPYYPHVSYHDNTNKALKYAGFN
ncbi:fibronectin type III domain-containing protein, partial [Patescibacteria group bacterium]|nr:fibronectin type III domain-containing protein [Patescibacteria group bacterium]